MRSSSLLGWFLIISLLLLSQSFIISYGSQITPLGRQLVEYEENGDESHGHHHDHLRVFVRKSKKKKKKDKSSATPTLLSNPFTYVPTVPLPISSENQESLSQILTSLGRRLAQHGDSNPLDHRDSLRVFLRKVRGGGGRRRRHRRVPSTGHGAGGSSATSRPSPSIALRFGSTVLISILLIFLAF